MRRSWVRLPQAAPTETAGQRPTIRYWRSHRRSNPRQMSPILSAAQPQARIEKVSIKVYRHRRGGVSKHSLNDPAGRRWS
jgi:hypothetical protein